MLEQMRKAGLALRLVLRADIVPDADRDDRRLVVLVDDDGQPVGQLKVGVRDRDLADQRGIGTDRATGAAANTGAVRKVAASKKARRRVRCISLELRERG